MTPLEQHDLETARAMMLAVHELVELQRQAQKMLASTTDTAGIDRQCETGFVQRIQAVVERIGTIVPLCDKSMR
tara:strand:+ start:886 stop:1107 length:222 start_codon:yes stop_codon:yes gene_type:complete